LLILAAAAVLGQNSERYAPPVLAVEVAARAVGHRRIAIQNRRNTLSNPVMKLRLETAVLQ
jgi:hypothetical protein